jgi:alpha-ribazole phosphatase
MTVEPARPSTGTQADGRLFLLRHGAVQLPGAGRHYIGQQDLPLSDRGRAQADAWAAYFATLELDAIVCSDLARCLESARIIAAASHLTPQARPELREIALGEWEGQSFTAIQRRDPKAFQQRGGRIADHRPPGGESFRDLDERIWLFFEPLLRPSPAQTLVVTHAGVIRVLLCRLLGMPLENLFAIGVAYGGLGIVAIRPGGARLQALNLPAPV